MNAEERELFISRLPALLIGGPPNAGKSVLTHHLSKALHRAEVPHYVLRASHDGEGSWLYEGNPEAMRVLRDKVRLHGKWSPEFRQLVLHLLQSRLLPLLVDLGGDPPIEDIPFFRLCTRSLLLLKEGDEISATWKTYVSEYGPTPFAEFISRLQPGGKSQFTSRRPILEGTLVNLIDKDSLQRDETFGRLAVRVGKLLREAVPEKEIREFHLDQARGEHLVDLPSRLEQMAPDQEEWSPDQLKKLLTMVLPHESLGLYGRAPVWVYGALAARTVQGQHFYQFDPTLGDHSSGWIEPPQLQATSQSPPKQPLAEFEIHPDASAWMLSVRLPTYYLDYDQANELILPEPPQGYGIILSGKLPLWLFTAMVRLYSRYQPPWIALHYAREERAIVIATSHTSDYYIGEPVLLPV
jgi:CRISPR-associated protein Csx3